MTDNPCFFFWPNIYLFISLKKPGFAVSNFILFYFIFKEYELFKNTYTKYVSTPLCCVNYSCIRNPIVGIF